jgi:hypothetical protein
MFAHGVYSDAESSKLYISVEDEIFEFNGDPNNDMNFDWTSKTFMLKKPTNYGAYVVDAEYEIADNVDDEEESAENDSTMNQSIFNSLPTEIYADGMPTILDALGSNVLGGMTEVDGPGPWGGGQYMSGSLFVGGNSPTVLNTLPTASQVLAGGDLLRLGGDTQVGGAAASGLATATRALAILKFAPTDTLPTSEQVRQAMQALRAAPHLPIRRGAL